MTPTPDSVAVIVAEMRAWSAPGVTKWADRLEALTPSAQAAEGALLHEPGPITAGCYCKPGQCAAPTVMGRQTACRDPAKAKALTTPPQAEQLPPLPSAAYRMPSGNPEWWVSRIAARFRPASEALDDAPVAWSRSGLIHDDDGRAIGTDEPEISWGPEAPDDEGWWPMYGGPK